MTSEMCISKFINNNYDIHFQGDGFTTLEDVSELILFTDTPNVVSAKDASPFLTSAITSFAYKKVHVRFLNQFSRKEDVILVEGSPALKAIKPDSPCAWVTKEVSTSAEILGCTTDCQDEFAKFATMSKIVNFGKESYLDFNRFIGGDGIAIIDLAEKLEEMSFDLMNSGGIEAERAKFNQFLSRELPRQEKLIIESLEAKSQKNSRTFLIVSAQFFSAQMVQLTSFLKLRNAVVLSPKQEVSNRMTEIMMSVMKAIEKVAAEESEPSSSTPNISERLSSEEMMIIITTAIENLEKSSSDDDVDEGPSSSTSFTLRGKRPSSDISRLQER